MTTGNWVEPLGFFDVGRDTTDMHHIDPDTPMIFEPGETVRVDLPDPNGPDAKYDGRLATVRDVTFDQLGEYGNLPELNAMYLLEFDNGEAPNIRFRVHDLRRPSNTTDA